MLWWLVAMAWGGDVSGHFELAEPEAVVQARIDAAVDAAASQFGLFKGIAKSRMARGAVWCHSYTFSPDATSLGWQCEDKPRFNIPRDSLGAEQTLELPKGNVQALVSTEGRDIHAWFAGDEGGRRQAFRFEGEDVLVFDVAIESPHLNQPMMWSIRYRRVAPPSDASAVDAVPVEAAPDPQPPAAE